MHKQCLIIGCGSHAHSVISVIESSNEDYEILGLVDIENNYDPTEKKSGYKVLFSLKDLLNNPSVYKHLFYFIAIGDNYTRKKVYYLLKKNDFITPNIVGRNAFVDRTVKLGDGNIISNNAVINAQSTLGNNNLVNTGAIIEHDCIIGDHNHLGPRSTICGSVNISDLVFLGANSTVLPNLNVVDGILLGAGSLLNFNALLPNSKIVGVPAKVKKK